MRVLKSLFNEGLKACNLIKKRVQYRCVLVVFLNFEIFEMFVKEFLISSNLKNTKLDNNTQT